MKKITQNLMVALTIFSSMAIISQTEVEDSTLQELEEVVLMGSGVIDLAADRVTPVAASTIKGSEIQKKIGTQDITMTLVNTPSVYVAGQAGGYGDSRIAVRGFEQDNTAYMLNGQPINGMEDGKMYWSNWSGMNDVASVVEIQRGLGASKLAISSVGGTVNFVMNSNDVRQGGFMYAGFANDDYLKTTYFLKTTCQCSRKIGCALIAMNSITTLMTGARNKKRSGKKIVLRMDYQLLTMIQCPRMTQN